MLYLLAVIALQGAEMRPMIECSEHMMDDRALRTCLEDLLDAAEDALDDAEAAARAEAAEIDLDMAGIADAGGQLDRAQTAWIVYRDAECERRAGLLLIGEDGEAVSLDCRIALTRARSRELAEQ
ncbi:lysozyme inhibitor LprI family protein [Hyphobacterium sp.]|uniref:lysozyme inhibitor LprI family protein n=1 Tax=Hyphobacterium sp. TaxID=2004662 RepID=UPI003B517C78